MIWKQLYCYKRLFLKNVRELGLRPGVNYISAIIAYNAEGRAVCSAFQTWKASGTEGAWSDGGSAGDLEENEW